MPTTALFSSISSLENGEEEPPTTAIEEEEEASDSSISDDNTYGEGEDQQEGDQEGDGEEEGEGDQEQEDDRHLIKGMTWHPAITNFWEKGMLNLTHSDWHSLGKGYLSVGDIYYLILAAPCFLFFFSKFAVTQMFSRV